MLGVRQVQFEPGSASLSPQALRDIEEGVIPVLRATIGTYLRIEGSAGWPVGAGLNEAVVNGLAFERARAVQDYIIKFGIPESSFSDCIGKGNHDPCAPNDRSAANMKKNRRVEIFVMAGSGTQKTASPKRETAAKKDMTTK